MDAMKGEIHVFYVVASALDGNQLALPAGKRYEMMLFMRQKKGTDDDWDLAKKTMSEAGFENIEIGKADYVASEKLKGMDPEFTDCYECALVNGSAFLIY
ncbi:MAG: hypothetical protein G8D88_05065 [gamma proteobacterium symbiont of Ctena orbiculata]